MKLIKKLAIGLFVFLLLFVSIAFVLPSKIHVERSIVINAAAAPAFEQVNTLKNWENWSTWHKMDPEMKLTYHGPDKGVGAAYSWTSNGDVGNGKITILQSEENKAVITSMDFMENGAATGSYLFQETPDGTVVTCALDSETGFNPFARYMGLFVNQFVGAEFEKNLENLKTEVETKVLSENR